MASLRLQPSDPFNFRNPDEWLKWKRRFEQFRSASGLESEGEQRQVSMLLYCLGEEADDVLTSTNISEENRCHVKMGTPQNGDPGSPYSRENGTRVPIHLQLDPDLTLEKTKKVVRQKEAVKEQQLQLGRGTKKDPIVLDEVRRAPTQKGAAQTPTMRGSQGTAKPQNPQCL